MDKKKYDIFISYRRQGGAQYARIIQQALVKRYNVFLDYDALKDGVFDRRIIAAIEEAPVFLLVLSKGALDRCVNEGDWVRKEIEYAHQCKRHFVPVVIDNEFEGLSDELPESLKAIIRAHQFSELQTRTLFEESMDKIVRHRIEPYVVHEEPGIGVEIHIETDVDCDMYRFRTFVKRLKGGEDNIVYLKPGNYKLEFRSVVFPEAKELKPYSLAPELSCDFFEIVLKDKVKEVEKRVAEEKRLAEEQKRREEEERRIKTFIVDGVSFKMIRVEGGRFMMGSPDSDPDAWNNEKPQHEVTLGDYYIGETQVTQALWKKVMDNNPSRFKGDSKPVEMITWNDCQEFLKKLNSKTGQAFRLPTEAEWEYAARGGNKSRGYKYAGSDDIDEVAWYHADSGMKTHLVKQKKANELGLYDMSGNVWEWCQDRYGSYSSGKEMNPTGPSEGSYRVLRGGSWYFVAPYCRVACRIFSDPDYRDNCIGFRLALVQQ